MRKSQRRRSSRAVLLSVVVSTVASILPIAHISAAEVRSSPSTVRLSVTASGQMIWRTDDLAAAMYGQTLSDKSLTLSPGQREILRQTTPAPTVSIDYQ